MKYVFFGTPQFASTILDELSQAGFPPALIVTAPDKPAGRKLILTPSPVKKWGVEHGIRVITPEKLRDDNFISVLRDEHADVFIVAAYGKIIPESILEIPIKGTLNVHPSLLPQLRGPSPVESAITEGLTKTGVSIMQLDALMDHGPIVAQEVCPMIWEDENPPRGSVLEDILAHQGGKLLVNILPRWIDGKITPIAQDHARATFCRKITKADGHIDLSTDPLLAIRKIRAFDIWPGTYFFVQHNDKDMRIRIAQAHIDDGALIIDRVIPESKNEMSYEDFKRGFK